MIGYVKTEAGSDAALRCQSCLQLGKPMGSEGRKIGDGIGDGTAAFTAIF